jgi:hypothetical protein
LLHAQPQSIQPQTTQLQSTQLQSIQPQSTQPPQLLHEEETKDISKKVTPYHEPISQQPNPTLTKEIPKFEQDTKTNEIPKQYSQDTGDKLLQLAMLFYAIAVLCVVIEFLQENFGVR